MNPGEDPAAPYRTVGFIGAGAAAQALARLLAEAGVPVVAVSARQPAHAEALAALLPAARALRTAAEVAARADLVLLAVPDDALAPLAEETPWRAGQGVVHLSGAHPAAALAAVTRAGAHPAALHPLMTFARTPQATPLAALRARLAGCTWALEAAYPPLASTLERLVALMGGHVLRLEGDERVPYHLAAVLASNAVVALFGAAERLWEGFGVAEPAARAALLPLLRAAVENLAQAGPVGALTGPVARGDLGTVQRHLAWLESQASTEAGVADLRAAYVALARLTLPLARAKGGLSAEASEAMERLLPPVGEG